MLASLGPLSGPFRTVRFGIVSKPAHTGFSPEAEQRLLAITAQQYDVDPQLLPKPKSREEAKSVPSASGAYYRAYFHELVYDRKRMQAMERPDTLPHEATHSILALARTHQKYTFPREYRQQQASVIRQFWQNFHDPETVTVDTLDDDGHALTVSPVVTPYIPSEQSRRRVAIMTRFGLPNSPLDVLEAVPDYFKPFMVDGMKDSDQVKMPLFQFGLTQLRAFAEAQRIIALAAMRSNTVPMSFVPTLTDKPFGDDVKLQAQLALTTQPHTLLHNMLLHAPNGLSASASGRILRYMVGNYEEYIAHHQGFSSTLAYVNELLKQPDCRDPDALFNLKGKLNNDLRLLELGKQLYGISHVIRRLPRKATVEKQRARLHFDIERHKKELLFKAGHIVNKKELGPLEDTVNARMRALTALIAQYVQLSDPDIMYEDTPLKHAMLKQAEQVTQTMRRFIPHATNNSLKHAPFLYPSLGDYQRFQRSFETLGLTDEITKDAQRYPYVERLLSQAIDQAYHRYYGTSYKLAL